MIYSFECAVKAIQSICDGGSLNEEECGQAAYEAGRQAWQFGTPDNLAPVDNLLKGELRKAFLNGLHDFIDGSSINENPAAQNLLTYARAQLQSFDA